MHIESDETQDERKLLWRCRRGVKELDVLFENYRLTVYPSSDAEQKQAFAQLLEQQDPLILDWLFGKLQPAEPALQKIIQRLQNLAEGRD